MGEVTGVCATAIKACDKTSTHEKINAFIKLNSVKLSWRVKSRLLIVSLYVKVVRELPVGETKNSCKESSLADDTSFENRNFETAGRFR